MKMTKTELITELNELNAYAFALQQENKYLKNKLSKIKAIKALDNLFNCTDSTSIPRFTCTHVDNKPVEKMGRINAGYMNR